MICIPIRSFEIWSAWIPNSTSHLKDLLWNISWLSGMADLNMNLKNVKRLIYGPRKLLLVFQYLCHENHSTQKPRLGTLKSIRYSAMGAISKYLYCFWQVCKYNRFVILVIEICTHFNEAILWLGNVSSLGTIHRSKWKYPN